MRSRKCVGREASGNFLANSLTGIIDRSERTLRPALDAPKSAKDAEHQENCKVPGEGVRSIFSADGCKVGAMHACRKMDQTPTLQSCAAFVLEMTGYSQR
jgi:hypothetical protein